MSEGKLRRIPGAVTAPQGFRAAIVNCGLKQRSPDMTLIVSDCAATCAVTITRNCFRAAPTWVTEEHAASGTARAVVVNSGNANAATGEEGLARARRMAELTGEGLRLPAEEVLVCSTGHIGVQLPLENIEAGIGALVPALSAQAGEDAARGIMTTDTFPKALAVEFEVEGRPVRLGGICKGAGMICPDMATMLCFLTTDAAAPAELLRPLLREAVDHSFNCVTVDGDMSTNDTVALLANGASGVTISDLGAPGYAELREALGYVTRELAKLIARDGEGATKFVEIRVSGARDFEQARRVGRAVANYTLLKTAVYGEDFNWGRLAAALGATEEDLDPARVTLTLAGTTPWRRGEAASFDLHAARERMQEKEITIELDLGEGAGEATVWTCDLSPGYIEFNAEYEILEEETAED